MLNNWINKKYDPSPFAQEINCKLCGHMMYAYTFKKHFTDKHSYVYPKEVLAEMDQQLLIAKHSSEYKNIIDKCESK